MTELAITCALAALALALAVSVGRWLLGRPAAEELRAASRLVSTGATRYLRRQTVVALSVAAVFAAAVLLAYGLAYQVRGLEQLRPREQGVIATVSYLVGAALALGGGALGAWTSRHTAVRVADAVRRSLDESLQLALRGGAV